MNKEYFEGKEILVTGGTGTLGKELSKQLKDLPIKGLRIFSRDEYKQWEMKKNLQDKIPENTSFLIGDVRDSKRLSTALKGVDIVIHTAAMKQVPSCEYNPIEAVKTNIEGTKNVIEASISNGVDQVMFISTDKAVYPVNLYGMTKATAEKLIIHSNVYSPGETKFNVCRYGNVLGSRGSVVQLFRDQYRENNKITLTDKEMTRFWITVEFMAGFILSNISEDRAQSIAVPKMKSSTVLELAHTLVPENTEIEIIGLRKGEKLHEVLISKEESIRTLECSDKYLILEDTVYSPVSFEEYSSFSSERYKQGELEEVIAKTGFI